ncbi:AAA family ATPase [[Eubacterium] cellulosolvens]
MTNSLRITQLLLEGFRGINKRVELTLDKNSAVIYGGNGAGKTSLLQSIEWGLYGHLPFMKGTEFEREDAIVNQFNPSGTAEVKLVLENGGKPYTILRKRKKGKTSTGGSQLTLQEKKEIIQGEGAEKKINEVIGLTPDDFYATVYMHQDAVKTLISGNPENRNEVIDRLLGIRLLRDLSKAIPLTPLYERRKILQKMAEELEASSKQETLTEEKNSLEEFKRLLLERGLTSEDFALSSLASNLQNLKATLTDVGIPLGATLNIAESIKNETEELQEYSSTLMRALSKIDDTLSRELKESRETLKNIKTMREQYVGTLDSLASYDIDRFEDVSASKRQLENQIKTLEHRAIEHKKKKTALEKASLKLSQLEEDKMRIENDVKSLEDRLGGGEIEVQNEITTLQATITELNETINRSQIYNQILALGVEYLGRYKSEHCPLCKTSTSTPYLQDHLKGELSNIQGEEDIIKHQNSIKELQDKKEKLEEGFSEYRFLQEKLRENRQKTEEARREIKDLAGSQDSNIENLQDNISTLTEELNILESDLIKMKGELLKLESQGSLMKSLFTNFENLKTSIKSALPDWNETQGLNLLDGRIKALSETITELEKKDRKLKEVKNKLLDLTQAISYNLKKEKLIRMEGELPQVQRKLEELTLKIQKISELEDTLADVHSSIIQEQKNCFDKILKKIQGSIREYYEKILGHSYYQELEIELETNTSGDHTYWIKGRSTQDSTYVRTRYSEAQLNATALALFMAMVKHSSHHLEFTVFDDPTQSMDQIHKEAIARLLCQEMKDRQLIIATQDKDFYHLLKKHVNSGITKFYNIEDWSVKGPLLTVQSKMKSILGLF